MKKHKKQKSVEICWPLEGAGSEAGLSVKGMNLTPEDPDPHSAPYQNVTDPEHCRRFHPDLKTSPSA
jgi:hypothetical protein